MNIQTIILGFLMYASMTGYELKNMFAISFSFFSGLSFGSIYPALKKMEQQGLISMRMEIQEGAPNKKIYTITEKGRQAFEELLKEPLQLQKTKSAFLSRLFFFSHIEKQDRLKLVTGYLASIEEERQRLEQARPEIEAVADPFQKECFNFGVRLFASLSENIGQTLRALEEIE